MARFTFKLPDMATVEIESPVAGTVVERAGEVGDQVAIGSALVVIETADAAEPAGALPMADSLVDGTPEGGAPEAAHLFEAAD